MPKTLHIHERHAAQRSRRHAKPPTAVSAPRIVMAGKLAAWSAPGGGEVQMTALARALNDSGMEVRFWRPWEDRGIDADCLHLFGSEPEHLAVARAARRQGVPVVLSTIAWFDLASCWREPWRLARRVAACGKFALRAAAPWLKSWRRELYHAADLLLPNSQAEAAQLIRYFNVSPERIRVVPNGAERRFTRAESEPFARRAGCRRFVLYPGRIEPRKNQLGFLRAMQGAEAPIVVLGDVVPGHEAYLAACRRAAGPHVKFIGRIEREDPLLASAYAAAACVALASWYETPGLAALEAGMSGTPLVLPRGGCAREYFGELASYVSPGDLTGIRAAVLAALARGRSPQLAALVRQNYSWAAAAAATREAYEKVL